MSKSGLRILAGLRGYISTILVAFCSVAVASGAVIYATYSRDISELREQVRGGSQLAQTTMGPIEYAQAGQGFPALISHGAGGGYDQGLTIAAELLADSFLAIAPSRFGYLRTPLPARASPEAQADAHAALLDTLKLERVIVLGFSAGARSAVEFALRHPNRIAALILVSPITYAPTHAPELAPSAGNRFVLRLMLAGADFASWCALKVARSTLVRFAGVPPELETKAPRSERKRVTAILRGMLPFSLRAYGISNDASIPLTPWPLETISTPTLVIAATDDLFNTLQGARFTAEHIPKAELAVLETGGHLLIGRLHEVQAKVAAFLSHLNLELSYRKSVSKAI